MKTLAERSISASLIILGGTGCYFILSIITQSFIGHRGGPLALGRYSAALMAIEFVATLVLLGTPNALNRYASLFLSTGRREESRSLLSGLLVFIVVASIAINALLLLFFDLLRRSHVLEENLRYADLSFIILGSFAFALSRSFSTYYHADYKNVKGVLITLSGPLVTLVLILISYAHAWRITLVQLVGLGFIAGALFSLLLSVMGKELWAQPTWNLIRDLVIFSVPLFGVSLVAYFSTWVDRIIVGVMANVENLGILTAAVVVVRAIRFIPQALTPVFVTSYSRILAVTPRSKKISSIFSTDLFFVCLFCLGMASTIYMWAPIIVRLLWGPGFGSLVVTILRIELFGLLGLAHSLQTPNFLVVMGRPSLNFRLALMHIVLQSVLSLVLIWRLGIVGIAAASAATLVIMAYFRHKAITSNLGIPIQTRPLFLLGTVFILSVAFYHIATGMSLIPPIWVSVLGNFFAVILFAVILIRTPLTLAVLKTALQKPLSGTRNKKGAPRVGSIFFKE